MLQEKGTLFVISAPSGAGKNSLLHEVLTGNDQLKLAISHTTRLPRPGESEGKSYYFIDEDDFKHLIEEGNFIEYAKVFGCVDHNRLENSKRNENTRPPDLHPEKSVCKSRSNS